MISTTSNPPPPTVQTTLKTTDEEIVVFILIALCILGGFSILWSGFEVYYNDYILENNIWANPVYHVVKLLYSIVLLGFTIALQVTFHHYKKNNNFTNNSTLLTRAVHAIVILAYIIIGYEFLINSIQLMFYLFSSTHPSQRLKRVNTYPQQLQ